MEHTSSLDRSGRPDGPPQIQSLVRGIEILEHLVAAGGSMSGVELARLTGLHPSSISRITATLIGLGYVRKAWGGYRADFGVLNFLQAAVNLPEISQAQSVIERLAEEHEGCFVNLCLLRHGQLIYAIRSMAGLETTSGITLPLQQSSAAMRLLVTLDRAEALAALRSSRERFGWMGGPGLPGDEVAALDWATANIRHDVLVLDSWSGTSTSGAIPLAASGATGPMAVAIGSPAASLDPTDLGFVLHDARRQVEAALGR